MADKELSELASAATPSGTELVHIVQSGNSRKATLAAIFAALGGSGYTDEQARDAIGTALTAGTGITVTPNDGSDIITIATTITQYNDEMARDAIGAALVEGSDIDITVDDAGNTITIALVAQPYDTGTFISGTPGASEKVLRMTFNREVTFADDFAGSHANADTAATASTVFNVKKNGSNIGTITFAASGTTGTFATTGSGVETFTAGDVLSVVAPASPDATLADISILFAGER